MSRVVTVPLEPGSMLIFRGSDTVHRVRRTEGPQSRVVALFSYETVSGRVYGAPFRTRLLGREHPRPPRHARR